MNVFVFLTSSGGHNELQLSYVFHYNDILKDSITPYNKLNLLNYIKHLLPCL